VRKIAPVIIWDFGGQDVFYSTHQTFLTYRAIYMLILDGSRTLDELCSSKKYMPGKGGARTQRGNSHLVRTENSINADVKENTIDTA
jgi:GTPase SAR1 family protein